MATGTPNLFDLASMSAWVYGSDLGSAQVQEQLPTDTGTWAVISLDEDPSVGFQAAALRNLSSGQIVIAIRGTVPTLTNGSNIAEDLELGSVSKYAPILNAVANDAIAFAQAVADANPGATITITGHSLGGYAAQAALVRLTQERLSNVSAVTFNAPGLPSWLLGNASPSSFNCYNFNTWGDAIHDQGGTQIGQSTILDVGPSPDQEMSDFQAGFQAGIGFGAVAGEAEGLKSLMTKDWLTAAHTITNFVGTNPYTQ